jgi:hypothetical protein
VRQREGRRAQGSSCFLLLPRARDRVPQRVDPHLGLRGRDRIDAQRVARLDQIEQDIGHLGPHGLALLRRRRPALRLGHPLEMLQQLPRLHDHRRGQVLREMELLPLALPGELVELVR